MRTVRFAWPCVALAACDPTWSGVGHLVDATGAPIAGATATLACPSGRVETAKSDATGTFEFGGVGSSFEAPKCGVTIDASGFVKRTLTVYDLSYRNTESGNAGVPRTAGEGTIVLARAASAPLSPVVAPTSAYLHAVAADAACGVVAVGSDGAILRSRDDGITWTARPVTERARYTSAALDGDDLYVVGDASGRSVVVRIGACGDGDATPLKLPAEDQAHAVAAEGGHVYVTAVARMRGRIFCSDDRGGTMRVCDEQPRTPYYGLRAVASVVLVAGGYRGDDGGIVRRSDDQGRTWSTVARGLGTIAYDVWSDASARRAVVTGQGSQLWATDDAFAHSRAIGRPGSGRGGSMALAADSAPYVPNDFATWVAGDASTGTFVTLGGNTVRGDLASLGVTPVELGPVDAAVVTPAGHWVAVGTSGRVRRSVDDARTWSP